MWSSCCFVNLVICSHGFVPPQSFMPTPSFDVRPCVSAFRASSPPLGLQQRTCHLRSEGWRRSSVTCVFCSLFGSGIFASPGCLGGHDLGGGSSPPFPILFLLGCFQLPSRYCRRQDKVASRTGSCGKVAVGYQCRPSDEKLSHVVGQRLARALAPAAPHCMRAAMLFDIGVVGSGPDPAWQPVLAAVPLLRSTTGGSR